MSWKYSKIKKVVVLNMPVITSGSRINRGLGEELWLHTWRGFAEATWHCVISFCPLRYNNITNVQLKTLIN